MLETQEAKKVYWHSRRGMLELDLMLVPFVEQKYEQLPEADRAIYRDLLSCEDTDIFEWLMQRGRPERDDLYDMVQRIVQLARTKKA